MHYTVAAYDEYYDIPLRGLLRLDETVLAFEARILPDEPVEMEGIAGVPANVRGFACDAELVAAFDENDVAFRKWRTSFDRKEASAETHPIFVSDRYRELSSQIASAFQSMVAPVFEVTGVFRVENGVYLFEPIV